MRTSTPDPIRAVHWRADSYPHIERVTIARMWQLTSAAIQMMMTYAGGRDAEAAHGKCGQHFTSSAWITFSHRHIMIKRQQNNTTTDLWLTPHKCTLVEVRRGWPAWEAFGGIVSHGSGWRWRRASLLGGGIGATSPPLTGVLEGVVIDESVAELIHYAAAMASADIGSGPA